MRDDEITAIGDQLNKRFKVNTTDLIDEAVSKVTEGTDFFSQTQSIGNFTFKEFSSKSELDDYISSEKIG